MKEAPTQIRFEAVEHKWLDAMAAKTGVSKVDMVRLAVRELRKKHKSADQIIAAQILSRQEAAK